MRIPPFRLERFFAQYEFETPFLLCASDCESLAVKDLLAWETEAAEALQSLWLGYTESPGGHELRAEISGLYTQAQPDNILVFAGAEEAILAFTQAMLMPGDHVIVHYPCYQSLFQLAESSGCEVTRWETSEADGWELDINALRRHLRPDTRAVIVNCPHNPTGYQMSQQTWRELTALSRAHGFLLFSDEVYRLLEYREEDRLPALCDMDERGISLGVMSKAFGLAGLRIGWVATRNRAVYQQMAAYKDYTTICNSAPSEFLAALALRHREKILTRNRGLIRDNLTLLNAFFAQHGDLFRWSPPHAGPIAFPTLLTGEDVEEFCRRLAAEAGVLLLPGTVYDPGSHQVRIGFGRANLPAAVDRLTAFLRSA